MVRGLCFNCGGEVGGFLTPQAWQCGECKKVFCGLCTRVRVGLVVKKAVCTSCRAELMPSVLAYPRTEPLRVLLAT